MTRGGIVRGETLPRTCVSGRIRRLRLGSCAPRPSRDGHIRPELESATFQIFSTRCTHVREPTPSLTRRRLLSPTTQPVATVALFGKKPAAKKPPAKKPLVKKAAPKPIAKKKPVAKKAAAKKPAAKPLFSFGSSKPKPAAKGTMVKKVTPAAKSKYTIKKTAGSQIKKSTTSFKTVDYSKKKPVTPAGGYGVKPMGGGSAIKSKPVIRAPKAKTLNSDEVGTLGVAGIFAGTFLLTLAVLPSAFETALEVIGIGYTAFFTYNWITNPSASGDLDKVLTEIDDATGINVKKIASVTGELAESTSKKLAESAEKSAEARAKAKLEAKANPPVDKIEPAA